MSDTAAMAALSHAVERLSIAMSRDDPDEERVLWYLADLSGSHREVLGLALSYVLRRRETSEMSPVLDRAVASLATVLRRTAASADDTKVE